MNKLNNCCVKGGSCIIFGLALLAAAPISATAADGDERSLARGAVEDVTLKQKYRTAIREAGGAYKEWLRECVHMPLAESRACRLDAKATYDRDMAQAQLILHGRVPVQASPRR